MGDDTLTVLSKFSKHVNLNFRNRKINIPFTNEKEAQIAFDVLRVDKEPPRSQVSKLLNIENNVLKVYFSASTAHQLRTGINGFLDHLILVCETIICFGPPVNSQYTHFT